MNIRHELGPDRLRGLYAIAGNGHKHRNFVNKTLFWVQGSVT